MGRAYDSLKPLLVVSSEVEMEMEMEAAASAAAVAAAVAEHGQALSEHMQALQAANPYVETPTFKFLMNQDSFELPVNFDMDGGGEDGSGGMVPPVTIMTRVRPSESSSVAADDEMESSGEVQIEIDGSANNSAIAVE